MRFLFWIFGFINCHHAFLKKLVDGKYVRSSANIYRSYIDALLYPEQNPFIEDMKRFEELMMMYSCAIKEVQTKLDVLNTDFSVRYNRNPIEFIQSRIKKPVSIATKLSSRGCQVSVENIVYNLNDVAGLRVICSFIDDIYSLSNPNVCQNQPSTNPK